MPTYEYECHGTAQHRFEKFQRFSEPPVQACPECGSLVRRVIFPAGVIFKGPGFYKTDARVAAKTDDKPSTSEQPDPKPEPAADAKAEPAPVPAAKAEDS